MPEKKVSGNEVEKVRYVGVSEKVYHEITRANLNFHRSSIHPTFGFSNYTPAFSTTSAHYRPRVIEALSIIIVKIRGVHYSIGF